MKNIFLFVSLVFLAIACEPVDAYHHDVADFIELKKDPCFGFCPVYEVKINGIGEAVFNGKRNVSKEGLWYQTLTADETNDLFAAFEEAGFWDLNDEYTSQVTDLPTTWTTLVLGEKTKTIKDYYGAPEELKSLEALIEAIAEREEGWERHADAE